MIGWTKTRKKCPTHGLVLRNRDEYDRSGDYCPACGERLTVISIPYLFQIYFDPSLIFIPGILIFFYGLFVTVLDVPGCLEIDRNKQVVIDQQQEIKDQKTKEQLKEVALSLPPQWKSLHAAMDSVHYNNDKWAILRQYFTENPEIKLPKLDAEQLRVFLDNVNNDTVDNAFSLLTKHMQSKEKVEP